MLVYEKKEKKPIRLIVNDEIKELQKESISTEFKNWEEKTKLYEDYKKSNGSFYTPPELKVSKDPPQKCPGTLHRSIYKNLYIPRGVFVYMSENQKEKQSRIKLEIKDDQDYIKIVSKDVHKFIPHQLFKKVWEDNNAFLSERQLNSSDFFMLFSTISQEKIEDFKDNHEKLRTIFELTFKMIFMLLVYAHHNESIKEVSTIF